jgi:zinc transport system substrate-binding protein
LFMKMLTRWCLMILSLACTLDAAGERLRVAVTLMPQVAQVEAIGGPHVAVFALQQGADSCSVFDARPSQMAELARSTVYFRIGAPLETVLAQRLPHTHPQLRVVNLSAGLELLALSGDHQHHVHADGHMCGNPDCASNVAAVDPHVWLDPLYLAAHAQVICQVLEELLPDHRTELRANLARHLAALEAVHAQLQEMLADYSGRSFYVYHAAFGYFANRYGLQQIALEADGREPGPRRLRALIAEARTAGARTIFVQAQESVRHAEIVAAAIGATITELDPMAADWQANLLRIGRALVAGWQLDAPVLRDRQAAR